MTDTPPPTLADGLRFAFGTLTVLPVRVTRWDRPAARRGMLCAPLAGLVIGVAAAAAGGGLLALGGGTLLAAVATVAVPAVLTRGLHLDGLADTADGLGSGGGTGRAPSEALRIMKQPDIGPFGVVTLLLVLSAQVAAVARLYERDGWAHGALAAVLAALAARTALVLACREGVPPARSDGLGSAVAALVPRRAALAMGVCAVATAAVAAWLLAGAPLDAVPAVTAVSLHRAAAVALALALAAAELLLGHCRRRFGGVTGDVLGALAETAATTALVVLALDFRRIGPGF